MAEMVPRRDSNVASEALVLKDFQKIHRWATAKVTVIGRCLVDLRADLWRGRRTPKTAWRLPVVEILHLPDKDAK
jgi:hypothetical protein